MFTLTVQNTCIYIRLYILYNRICTFWSIWTHGPYYRSISIFLTCFCSALFYWVRSILVLCCYPLTCIGEFIVLKLNPLNKTNNKDLARKRKMPLLKTFLFVAKNLQHLVKSTPETTICPSLKFFRCVVSETERSTFLCCNSAYFF